MTLQPRHYNDELPTAVWLPNSTQAVLPSCYQGSPLEMVRQMADDLNPGIGVHDAIDWHLKFLLENRGLRIQLPKEAPEDKRAAMFLVALLASGLAAPMAKA